MLHNGVLIVMYIMCELMSVFFCLFLFSFFVCVRCCFGGGGGGGGECMLTIQYPNVHFHESLHYYLWVLVLFCCCFDIIIIILCGGGGWGG